MPSVEPNSWEGSTNHTPCTPVSRPLYRGRTRKCLAKKTAYKSNGPTSVYRMMSELPCHSL